MALKEGTKIATIDVALVTIKTTGETPTEIAIKTASEIGVEPQIEKTDAVKNIVKGVLIAQKAEESTLTGHKLTLTDNVFMPEVVKILQGGTITYDAIEVTKITGYTPPVVGSADKGQVFTVCAYSSIYNAAGVITGYECIEYPNCQGIPVAFGTKDGAFRAPAYTINSAPGNGEAPYEITYVAALPTITA